MGCIPWADGCIIRGLTPQRETTPHAGSAVSQERRQQAHLAALSSSYITHKPEGGPSVAAGDNTHESRAEGCASGEPVTRDTGKQATQRRQRQRTNGTAPEPSSERGSSNKTGNTLTTSDMSDMKTPGIPIRERHP